MAVGMKTRVAVRSAYLAVYEFAALLAADPAWAELASICESAKVSGIVTSHAVGFLWTMEVTSYRQVFYCFLWSDREVLL